MVNLIVFFFYKVKNVIKLLEDMKIVIFVCMFCLMYFSNWGGGFGLFIYCGYF